MTYLEKFPSRQPLDLVTRHFAAGKQDPIEHWSRRRILDYQIDALNDLLDYTARKSPFYRARWQEAGIEPKPLERLEDLARYPMTTREEIADDPWSLITVPPSELAELFLSSGTSGGNQVLQAHSYNDQFVNDLAPPMPILVPLDENDLVVNALPYETSSAGLAFHRVFVFAVGAAVFNAGKDGAYGSPELTRDALDTIRATAMITSPSYATRMIEYLPRSGSGPPANLRFLYLTGEGCSSALRERLEKLWGVPCYGYYGSLECGGIAIECLAQDGYHLSSGNVLVEIVDGDGSPVPPGIEGEIVVTPLLRRGMPMIRYRTRDQGFLEDLPCECGLQLQRLVLRGRDSDRVRCGDEWVSPIFVEEALMRNPEVGNWYQIQRRKNSTLRIEVVPSDPGYDRPEVKERIESKVGYIVGGPVEIRFVESVEILSGKIRRVRDVEEET